MVVESLEGSLSLPMLFFPLWDTQLQDYVVNVKSTSLNNLLMSEINLHQEHFHVSKLNKSQESSKEGVTDHFPWRCFLHQGNALFLEVLLDPLFIYGINRNTSPQSLECCV